MQRSQRTMTPKASQETIGASSLLRVAALAADVGVLSPQAAPLNEGLLRTPHKSIVTPTSAGNVAANVGAAFAAANAATPKPRHGYRNGVSRQRHKTLMNYYNFMLKLRKGAARYNLQQLSAATGDAGKLLEIVTKVVDDLDNNSAAVNYLIHQDQAKKLRSVVLEAAALIYLEAYGVPKKIKQSDNGAMATQINAAVANMEKTLHSLPSTNKTAFNEANKKETESILSDKAFRSIITELKKSVDETTKKYKAPKKEKQTTFNFLNGFNKGKASSEEITDSTWTKIIAALGKRIKMGALTRQQSMKLISTYLSMQQKLAENLTLYTAATAVNKSRLSALDVENVHTAARLTEKKMWTPAADFVLSIAANRVTDGIERRISESRKALMTSWVPEKPLPTESDNVVAKFYVANEKYVGQEEVQNGKNREWFLNVTADKLLQWIVLQYKDRPTDAFADDRVQTVASFIDGRVGKPVCTMKPVPKPEADAIWQGCKTLAMEKIAAYSREIAV